MHEMERSGVVAAVPAGVDPAHASDHLADQVELPGIPAGELGTGDATRWWRRLSDRPLLDWVRVEASICRRTGWCHVSLASRRPAPDTSRGGRGTRAERRPAL